MTLRVAAAMIAVFIVFGIVGVVVEVGVVVLEVVIIVAVAVSGAVMYTGNDSCCSYYTRGRSDNDSISRNSGHKSVMSGTVLQQCSNKMMLF